MSIFYLRGPKYNYQCSKRSGNFPDFKSYRYFLKKNTLNNNKLKYWSNGSQIHLEENLPYASALPHKSSFSVNIFDTSISYKIFLLVDTTNINFLQAETLRNTLIE